MSLENMSLEQRDELALLMKQLSENPETRKEALRLTKKLRPDLPMPELEIEDYTEKAVSKANQRVEELERKLQEKEAHENLDKRRNSLMEKGLIDSKSDIEEIEKIMLEKGITNHESAAEYWQWMKQAAVPTPSGYNLLIELNASSISFTVKCVFVLITYRSLLRRIFITNFPSR